VEIVVPPLRDRRADIPLLAERLVAKLAQMLKQPARPITEAALLRLQTYDWPGNVRELENTLMRTLVLARGAVIDESDVAISDTPHTARPSNRLLGDSLREAERAHVERVLQKTVWNKRRAARLLGISRTRLDRIIAKHGLYGGDSSDSQPSSHRNGITSRPHEPALDKA
jgi:DNA-binding NtrC family response regulator